MKKLMLLTIIMFTTFLSFSQTATKTDSIVPLKEPIARLVIKDLIGGDGAKSELKQVYKLVDEKNTQIGLFKQKDSLKDEKINNLNFIINNKDQQIGLFKDMTNDLQKELKAQKFKTKFYKFGSILGLGTAGILGIFMIAK